MRSALGYQMLSGASRSQCPTTHRPRLINLLLFATLVSACSKVNIQHQGLAPTVRYAPGVVNISLPPQAETLAESRTLGWHSSSLGSGLGNGSPTLRPGE